MEDGVNFPRWREERRCEFLIKELESPRPFALSGARIGKEADAVLDSYRVVREHCDKYGVAGAGSLIVSMTRNLSGFAGVFAGTGKAVWRSTRQRVGVPTV